MNITETAKGILDKELSGVKLLYSLVESDIFKNAIDTLSKIEGKIIISGMGKSGHIGKKISTTLASTGTPSVFVHPAEASHGDLGIIDSKDAIILISCSGDTSELKDITLYAKYNKIKTLSIVSKKDSFLGENTDIALVTGKIEEAMPHLPAPTTSTTVMLVLGDIIAGCLSIAKSFDKTKYNKFHPGGFLGKSLSHIGDVIRKDNLPVVKEDEKMHDVILEITSKRCGIVAVLDNNGCVVGVISDGDLRRHIEDDLISLKARDIMTLNPKTVDKNVFVVDVIEILTNNKIVTMLVVDSENKLVGVAQLYDLLK